MTSAIHPGAEDYASARARAALRGIALHRQPDEYGEDFFFAVQGVLTRQFDTLAAFLEWLGRIETRGC
jgi:hypothetical protein